MPETHRLGKGLTPDDRTRLARLCGMLGSAHDGERAAAGLQADKLVRSLGLTWGEVLDPPPPVPPPPRRQWREPTSPPTAAAECLRWPEVLTPWERDFCGSLLGRWKISHKQQRVLDRLVSKARRYATATEGCDHV